MKKLISIMALALPVLVLGVTRQAARVRAASDPPLQRHGVQEFFTSGDLTLPLGVTSVMVEMWGGGGGGFDAGGGGGGGAYTRSVMSVVPGETYQVVVGAAGAVSGGNGGESEVLGPASKILLFAGGGQGGSATAGGAGGEADPAAEISHPGFQGYSPPSNAVGGAAYAANLAPNYDVIGACGLNSTQQIGCGGGAFVGVYPGGPGYVLITW
jgi:hypothetical protein